MNWKRLKIKAPAAKKTLKKEGGYTPVERLNVCSICNSASCQEKPYETTGNRMLVLS